ncbi:unnamed protein product [Sphagnum tenellum]
MLKILGRHLQLMQKDTDYQDKLSSSEFPFSSENATGPTRLGHPNSSKLQTKNKGVGVQQQQQKQQQAGVACEKHTYNKGR